MSVKELRLLDRYDNLNSEKFKKDYLKNRKPVIISNSFKCEAVEKWNLDYFKKIYPDKAVVLTIFNPDSNTLGSNVKVKLSEAIDLIVTNSDKDKKYYLMQRSIYEEFPELASDITVPKYVDNNYTHINFWLGEKGVNTKPHHDYYDNFLTQIFGRKRVRLYAPSDTPYLYPYSIDETMTVEGVQYPTVHVSRIADIDLLDINEFPKMKFATPFEGILNPGDILYIPAGWWHEVKSLDITASINFWWKIKINEFPLAQLTNQVYAYFNWFRDAFHTRIRSAFDLSEYQDDLTVSEFCLSSNLKCVSAYFLLSHLRRMSETKRTKSNKNNILEWKTYLEIAKNCNDELLDNKKIQDIINAVKKF